MPDPLLAIFNQHPHTDFGHTLPLMHPSTDFIDYAGPFSLPNRLIINTIATVMNTAFHHVLVPVRHYTHHPAALKKRSNLFSGMKIGDGLIGIRE